ncbi:MAG: response regulator [Myxococcales bacterium]|nr:MAG: response regulator [Myxococcales bacterium]
MAYRLAIIDDDEKVLTSLKRYFTLRNYGVDAYSDSAAAINGIKSRLTKIALVDIGMPGIDGLEVLRRLKKHNPLIQVVIMTGNATAQVVREALDAGASGFVVKPFDSLQMLEREIEKAIRTFESHTSKFK